MLHRYEHFKLGRVCALLVSIDRLRNCRATRIGCLDFRLKHVLFRGPRGPSGRLLIGRLVLLVLLEPRILHQLLPVQLVELLLARHWLRGDGL